MMTLWEILCCTPDPLWPLPLLAVGALAGVGITAVLAIAEGWRKKRR
jgi:hypothetical protein